MKYRCKICQSIFETKEEVCPMCYAPNSFMEPVAGSEEVSTDRVFQNAVLFAKDNWGVFKDDAKCIDCGNCTRTCDAFCHIDIAHHPERCLFCGQCILTCPTKALQPKSAIERIQKAKEEGKILIGYTSPGIRVSIGEAFGEEPGSFCVEKLVGALKSIGFDYVLDTTFGADLTILEEASELKTRIENDGVLPLMTSCCPAWVKYACDMMPQIIPHLSTCKSPIGMEGEMVKKYFCEKMHLLKENVYTVAITPCTSKKYEITQMEGTDAVLTVVELVKWLKDEMISWQEISPLSFDSIFSEGSGGGSLFGITGGVTTSLLRTYAFLKTGKNLSSLSFDSLHEEKGVKTFTLDLDGFPLRVAVVQGLKEGKQIFEEVKAKKSPYHVIEVMNCEGGCIGGGGQIPYALDKKKEVLAKRKNGLKNRDQSQIVRFAHQNPDIQKIYEDFLILPNGEIAHKYLHRDYQKEKQET